MNLFLQIILFLVFAGVIVGLSVFFKERFGFTPTLTRKIFHILTFTAAAYILQFLGKTSLFIFGTIMVLVILPAVFRGRTSRFYQALVRKTTPDNGHVSILLPLAATALGGTFSLLLFGQLAIIGLLISGWADGMAEIVGSKWGKIRYNFLKKGESAASRSLEGSLAFLITAFIAIMVAFRLLQMPLTENILLALPIVLCSTLIEALSPGGTDNFTVQVGASGLAFLLFQPNF